MPRRRPSPAAWWTPWVEIGLGAPEVIARRLDLMARRPLAPQTWAESQRMVLEKMAAAGAAWWALWRGAASMPWPTWTTHGPRPPRDAARRAASVASRVAKPASRRVRANVARLRRKA